MRLDLHHRPTLLKSWLATLHGPELTVRPTLVGPLPGWFALLRTAAGWHLAYALMSYAGSLAVSRGEAANPVAVAVQEAGTTGVVVLTLVLWWGGVALSSSLWWAAVRRARQLSNQAST
jgi:hypothetical protein